jgi:hypothetical protein
MKEPLVLVISKLGKNSTDFHPGRTGKEDPKLSLFLFFVENRAYVYQNRFFDFLKIHIYEP